MNEVIDIQDARPDLKLVAKNSAALILDPASMTSMMKLAEIMAGGNSTIPKHLQKNVGDCMAIVMQAVQWQMNPFAVAQKTHTVNGVLGYEGQLVNAVIQSSGVTKGRFGYEFFGPWEKIIGKTKVIQMPAKDDKKAYEFRVPDYSMIDEAGLGVRISATIKGESEPRTLELMLVQASVRNSPLWATDPKQQLSYLAVKRWARLYCPDVILGVYTGDELEEFAQPKERDITPQAAVEPKELEECSQEKFDENKTKWRELIISGKKTPGGLIAMINTKAILTEAQKLTIDSWAHEAD
jgi:hypothetical protein